MRDPFESSEKCFITSVNYEGDQKIPNNLKPAKVQIGEQSHDLLETLSLAKTLRGFEIKSLQPIVAALFHVTSVSCSKLLLFTSRYKRVLSVKAFQGSKQQKFGTRYRCNME